MIHDILDLMRDNSGTELRWFDKLDRCTLAKCSRKINLILKHIRTENIADINILIKAVKVNIGKKVGLKACRNKNKNKSEPWWKRRI